MEDFLNYLSMAKTSLKTLRHKYIHVVIGNESCDLDSCISAIALAFYLHKVRKLNVHPEAVVIPVQNVTKEDFKLRSENCFVLKNAGVSLDLLIYRDEIDLQRYLSTKAVTTTLVDHHMLTRSEQGLESTVTHIFDHRPVDPNQQWDRKRVLIKIEEVGSCCTLIADEVLRNGNEFICKELAYLLYQTMVFDTIALLPKNGKAKELDISIAKQLEEKYDFKDDRQKLFDKLWEAHNDISHLTPRQLLYKDLKTIDTIPIPGLPMLTLNFLKLNGSYSAIQEFAIDNNSSVVILVGLETNSGVQRDIGVYCKEGGKHFRDTIVNKLKQSKQNDCDSFDFFEVETPYHDIICLTQRNIKLSRKWLIPQVKSVLLK